MPELITSELLDRLTASIDESLKMLDDADDVSSVLPYGGTASRISNASYKAQLALKELREELVVAHRFA